MAASTEERKTVLRELIDERGLIHSRLAEKLGLDRSHFTRILSAERPCTPSNAATLAALLQVDQDVFFDGESLRMASEDAA